MMPSNQPPLNNDEDNDAEMANDTDTAANESKKEDDDSEKIKRSPNRLMVDGVSEVVQGDGDNSCVLLSMANMDELGLFRGDSVLIKGKKRHSTVCIALANEQTDAGKIRMNRVIRKNLRIKLGDVVSLHSADKVKYGTDIHVLPFADSVDGITGSLFDTYLKPYFQDSYHHIKKGDYFSVRGGFSSVAPETLIHCDGDPMKREDEAAMNEVGYDDIGGASEALMTLREMSELDIRFYDKKYKKRKPKFRYSKNGKLSYKTYRNNKRKYSYHRW